MKCSLVGVEAVNELHAAGSPSDGVAWRQGWLATRSAQVLLLGTLFLGLAWYRLAVGWSGQLYWPDEYRYLHALHVVDELRKGSPSQALHWVFGVESGVASRPSYILMSTVPATAQGLANVLFGVQPTDPAFYRIPVAVNVLLSLGVTWMFYRIVLRLTGDWL